MNEQHITIPSIAERQHRPCNTCVWTGNMYSCAMCALNYEMEGERTSSDLYGYSLEDPVIQTLPCRFHMTPDELRMILDPYFME